MKLKAEIVNVASAMGIPIKDAVYTSLNPNKNEIRLLKVLGGYQAKEKLEPLQYKLITVSMDHNPRFTALSYVWGDPNDTEQIDVNGGCLHVPKSLTYALQYVGYHWKSQFPGDRQDSFYIWADAICINQQNVAERNRQVQLMGKIYSKAELVIAWFGSDPKIQTALTGSGIMSNEVAKDIQAVSSILAGDTSVDLDFTWMAKDTSFTNLNAMNGFWGSYLEFAFHNYWRRVWIFQERMLAQKLLLTAEFTSLSKEHFEISQRWLQASKKYFESGKTDNPKDLAWSESGWSLLKKLLCRSDIHLHQVLKCEQDLEIWKMHPEKNYETMMLILDLGSKLVASDSRDHIYGLLGMFPLQNITPDYEKTNLQLYIEYLNEILEHGDHFNWLEYGSLKHKYGNYPSWLPLPLELEIFPGFRSIPSLDSGSNSLFEKSTSSTRIYGKTLSVDAILGPRVLSAENDFDDPWGENLGRLEGIWKQVHKTTAYVTGIHPARAFLDLLKLCYDFPSSLDEPESYLRIGIYMFLALSQGEIDLQKRKEMCLDTELCGELVEIFFPFAEASLKLQLRLRASGIIEGYNYETACTDIPMRHFTYYNFVWLEGGYIGFGHSFPGSKCQVSVIRGCRHLIMVTKEENSDKFNIVGACVVLGLMNGDMKDLLKTGKASRQRITLV
jgi:hypothetical protein